MINAAIQEQIVKVFLSAGLLEWEDALHDNKEDDTKGEQVNLRPLVLLALLDLRRHIRHCSSIRFQCVDVLVAGEAKVSHLQVELLVNQNVFQFYVTVYHAFVMHVFKGVEKLSEEESAGVFAHRSHCLA